jgi:ribonuclease HI
MTSPILIWCDGSCSPNPGPGGWGAIVELDGKRQELSGNSPESTNNVMEMTAAIEALKRAPAGSTVTVTTDSQYVQKGISEWIAGWKRNGWRTAGKKPVKNGSCV